MPRRSSVIQSIGLSRRDLAKLLLELRSEGETLPPGAFDELAEASLESHAKASEAVLGAVDAETKLSLGLALARCILDDVTQLALARKFQG